MRTRASSVGRFFAVVVTALSAYAGCTTSKTGGETHWLGECATDRDCGTARCLCGICSRVCAGDGDCAGSRSAQCYAAASPGLAHRCASAMPQGTGICLAVCSDDADCPPGDECHAGACVAAPAPAAPADAAPTRPSLPPTGDIATHYVHTDAGAAFGELVAAPEPTTFIDGNAEDLVGMWEETEGDAGPCMAGDTVDNITYVLCMNFEITKDAATGKIVGQASFIGDSANEQLPGPFPPATDPDHGYPVGVDPADYYESYKGLPDGGLSHHRGLTNGGYVGARDTILDGHVEGNEFSFWLADTELWKDWCALQTPYPFQIEGTKGYRCVPQDATATNTDLGKFLLCTSVYDEGVCSSSNGDYFAPSPAPCVCVEDAGKGDPRCAARLWDAICTCTATRCEVNLRLVQESYRLAIDGNTMRSTTEPSMTFRRVSR